jgi:hypothetical protein
MKNLLLTIIAATTVAQSGFAISPVQACLPPFRPKAIQIALPPFRPSHALEHSFI